MNNPTNGPLWLASRLKKEMNVDINMNTSVTLAQTTSGDIGIAVLKKAIDSEAQGAMALINAIPQPPQPSTANLPPNLGRNINTTA